MRQLKQKAKQNKAKAMLSFMDAVGEKERDYDGHLVKLVLDDFVMRAQNEELSKEFVNWLEEHGEEVFVARKDTKLKNFYSFDGVEPWIFNSKDLKDCK